MKQVQWCVAAVLSCAIVQGRTLALQAAHDEGPDHDGGSFELDIATYMPASINNASIAARSITSDDRTAFDCSSDYILLFSLGKTGTTTFDKSLQQICGFGVPYALTPKKTYNHGVKAQKELSVAMDFISKVPAGHRIWIISGVRNPFDRLVSAYFQSRGSQIKDVAAEIPKLHIWLHNNTYNSCNDGARFFADYKKLTHLDMLKQEFDYRYKRIVAFSDTNHGKNPLKLVLLRMEDIEKWPIVLIKLFPNFKLVPDNEASEKDYAEVYHRFKKEFKFKPSEFGCISDSPVFHFYSDKQVAEMKAKVPRV